MGASTLLLYEEMVSTYKAEQPGGAEFFQLPSYKHSHIFASFTHKLISAPFSTFQEKWMANFMTSPLRKQ